MKVACYLDDTMELIGIIDLDAQQAEVVCHRHGGVIQMAERDALAPYGPSSFNASATATFNVIRFQFEAIYGRKGQTVICKIAKREHLALWPKQLWPRRRSKRYKLTKSDRRYRAQQQGTQNRLPYNGLRR